MKKILSLSLTLMLLFTIILPTKGFAEENKDLEKAITTAKSILGMTETYDTFSYTMYKQNDKMVFYLSWNDSKNKLGGVNVTIDSEGRITNYYCYNPYDRVDTQSKIPAISKSDALKTANEFIAKANKSVAGKLQYQDDNKPLNINDRNYQFYYIRIENGVVFPQNSVNVHVNNRTGKVEYFSVDWTDDITFPYPSGVISKEKAQQLYTEKLGLKLAYKLTYAEKNPTPYLVYTNVFSNRSIDAITGDIVHGGTYYYLDNMMSEAPAKGMAQDGGSNVVLTPEEKEAIENSAKLLSQSNAESIARKALNLDSSFNLKSINLYSNGSSEKDYVWSMYFSKEEKRDGKSYQYTASINIDAVSGDVLYFYRTLPYESNRNPQYNKDQALNIANNFIKTMQPSKTGEVEYTTWEDSIVRPLTEEEQPREYSFSFTRKSNGIYFINNGFTLTVDAVTGTITNYNFNWYDGQLPPSDKIISSEEAHKKLYENIGLRLQYMAVYNNNADTMKILPPDVSEIKPEIKLVYALNPGKPSNIDALSGELLDYMGKPFKENVITEYTDIEGNSAQKEINILAQYGISLPGSEFKPDNNITQKEFLYLLMKSTNPYTDISLTDDEDKLYEYLVNQGVIKESEKAPASGVTRQDAAKYIIRMLKYDKIADISGIYKLSFKDSSSINKDLYGYVAICYGLNIIKDDKGYFKPKSNLTKAQAAVLIYNLLNIN